MEQNLFDLSRQYDEMLSQGLKLSGEDKDYFIRGRVQDLRSRLPAGFDPRHILDFGCGTGSTTRFLAETFPQADVTGLDTAEKALEYARGAVNSPRVRFRAMREFEANGIYDLCYVNGVFHHIDPERRAQALARIHRALRAGGLLAFFENNPWNPGTRLVMRRIPFDRDAEPIAPPAARRLLTQAGFKPLKSTSYLFYFPRMLASLRFTERWLSRLPLGAQYHILAVKN